MWEHDSTTNTSTSTMATTSDETTSTRTSRTTSASQTINMIIYALSTPVSLKNLIMNPKSKFKSLTT